MRVGWSTDRKSAYLYDDSGQVVGRWFQGRPDISTFEPSAYGGGTQGPATQVLGGSTYGAGAASPTGGVGGGGTTPSAGGQQGGQQGIYIEGVGWVYDPALAQVYVSLQELGFSTAEAIAIREQSQRQFDQTLAYQQQSLAQAMQIVQMQLENATGIARMQLEAQMQRLQTELASVERVAGLDRTERAREADMNFNARIQEMWSGERIEAATRSSQPINYRIYENWLAGLGGTADPSGLPPGAPLFQTGPGTGGVAGGTRPAADVYGAQLAAGGRVAEFGAWGGPTTPVGGTPWVAPAQANLTQFSNQPLQAQEMAYARWRERGIMPNTAQQVMRAAAPTGTAGRAVGYG